MMKARVRILLAGLCLALPAMLQVTFHVTDAAHAQPPKAVGGPCAYADHPGVATIVSVTALPPASPDAFRPHRILFTFQATPMVANPLYAPGKVHEMTLTGGTQPGAGFVKKYGIAEGRKMSAVLHLIRSGTCTPVLFTFTGVDLSDHSERGKSLPPQ